MAFHRQNKFFHQITHKECILTFYTLSVLKTVMTVSKILSGKGEKALTSSKRVSKFQLCRILAV